MEEGVATAQRLAAVGFDALVPVEVSTFWDASVIRGEYPDRAWELSGLQDDYAAVFGGHWRARAVALANRLQAAWLGSEPAWNADFCRRVRDRVDAPVLCEGGIRERARIDGLLGGDRPACDAVGMARPFYAEPRLPARLLDADAGTRVVCESCNNCTVPQAAGEPGVCRTPSVLAERGRLERRDAYDRDPE
jgi:2,4-dienoyl-CoA reductase-like NADH-dependent reductase (Old Yellow Enzyme family)